MKGMFIWMFAVANTQNAAETFLCLGCFGVITKNNSLLCSISLCSKTQGICRNVYTPTMAKMLDKRKIWVGLYCVKKDSRFQKKKTDRSSMCVLNAYSLVTTQLLGILKLQFSSLSFSMYWNGGMGWSSDLIKLTSSSFGQYGGRYFSFKPCIHGCMHAL